MTGTSSVPSRDLGRQQREWRYARHMQPPNFRVLLHNDTVNRSDYVVRVLVKVVDGLTEDTASGIMQEAHTTGVALVTSCFQELAELYCQRLRGCGLRSSLEPVRPNFSGAGASS
ncbi:hypothetical protein QBZ16_001510 [Prototheca wickerhamii]|uniref:Adaptor protein ClpS core domain-containing protein n=1 Tax=Prototheca wickerhamii TaxID=3111 RepID=A0AAD9ID73_PROWI|nr:hypothetical protein QBZ16_001510 [Prototheca wickerhamii]